MNDLEAMKNAAALGNAFMAKDDTIRAYALAFKGYDATLMADAVAYAVENCERLPTVKGVIAMYRKAEQLARTEAASEGVPCAYCRGEGGWRLPFSDKVIPEVRMAVAPYLPGIMVKDDAGMALGPAWGRLPACASHGLEIARKQGHGGYERPWVKDHQDELREWRDRWEAEHAEAAAAAIEREIASTKGTTRAFVTAAVNAPLPESVARTETFGPAVAPEPTPTGNVAPAPDFNPFADPPGMSAKQVERFDAGIPF